MVNIDITDNNNGNMIWNVQFQEGFELNETVVLYVRWTVPIAQSNRTTSSVDGAQLDLRNNTDTHRHNEFGVFTHKKQDVSVTISAVTAAYGL